MFTAKHRIRTFFQRTKDTEDVSFIGGGNIGAPGGSDTEQATQGFPTLQ
jgi:hypothetical protein